MSSSVLDTTNMEMSASTDVPMQHNRSEDTNLYRRPVKQRWHEEIAHSFNAHRIHFKTRFRLTCRECSEPEKTQLSCKTCIAFLCAECATNNECQFTPQSVLTKADGPAPHEVIKVLRSKPNGLTRLQLSELFACRIPCMKYVLGRMKVHKLIRCIGGQKDRSRYVLEHRVSTVPQVLSSTSQVQTGANTPNTSINLESDDNMLAPQIRALSPDLVQPIPLRCYPGITHGILNSILTISPPFSAAESLLFDQSNLANSTIEATHVWPEVPVGTPYDEFFPQYASSVVEGLEPLQMGQRVTFDPYNTAPDSTVGWQCLTRMPQHVPAEVCNAPLELIAQGQIPAQVPRQAVNGGYQASLSSIHSGLYPTQMLQQVTSDTQQRFMGPRYPQPYRTQGPQRVVHDGH